MLTRYLYPNIVLCLVLVLSQSCKKEDTSLKPADIFSSSVSYVSRCDITFNANMEHLDTGFVSHGFYVASFKNPTDEHYELIIDVPGSPQSNRFSVKNFDNHFKDNITYYVRPFIRYQTRIAYGTESSFTIVNKDTVPRAPTIKVVVLPGANGASNNFKLYTLNEGGSHIVKSGWLASETPNATLETAFTNAWYLPFDYCDTVMASFSYFGVYVKENVDYYIRGYVQNHTHIQYSEDHIFRYVDPGLLSFNFSKSLAVDTVLLENNVTAEPYSPTIYIRNELQLPNGIKMYMKVIEIKGTVNCTLGVLNSGDIVEIGSQPVSISAQYLPGDIDPYKSYCKFQVILKGSTNDDDYYCKYKAETNTTNTTRSFKYVSAPVYGKCLL